MCSVLLVPTLLALLLEMIILLALLALMQYRLFGSNGLFDNKYKKYSTEQWAGDFGKRKRRRPETKNRQIMVSKKKDHHALRKELI